MHRLTRRAAGGLNRGQSLGPPIDRGRVSHSRALDVEVEVPDPVLVDHRLVLSRERIDARTGRGELLAGLSPKGDDCVAPRPLETGQGARYPWIIERSDAAPRRLAPASAHDERKREVFDPRRLRRLTQGELRVQSHVDVGGKFRRSGA